MHIMYVDESGVEDLNSGTSHLVLLDLSVPAERWKALDQAIQQVKTQYDLGEAEIHTAWMHRRYSEQEGIPGFAAMSPAARRASAEIAVRKRAGAIGVRGSSAKVKAYRRESRAIGPYLHLTREERLGCLDDLARQIASWHDVRLFADAVSKPDFPNSAAGSPYEQAFEQILTRFEACLSNIGSTGIVVHDNNSTAALRLTRLARKFHADGTLYRQIPHIVETPLFVDSTLTSMIQMADVCSFALRRLLENNETRLWDIIESRVDRSRNTNVGVRHYTAGRCCRCRICVAHGRGRSRRRESAD